MTARARTLISTAVLLCGAIAASGLAASAAGARRASVRRECLNRVVAVAEPTEPTPTPVSEPFDPAVTGIFALLRRPSGSEDQVPLFNPLGEDLGYQMRSYYPAEIRQLAKDADGERYFLIPGYMRDFQSRRRRAYRRRSATCMPSSSPNSISGKPNLPTASRTSGPTAIATPGRTACRSRRSRRVKTFWARRPLART